MQIPLLNGSKIWCRFFQLAIIDTCPTQVFREEPLPRNLSIAFDNKCYGNLLPTCSPVIVERSMKKTVDGRLKHVGLRCVHPRGGLQALGRPETPRLR